jgi:hypothetical protein
MVVMGSIEDRRRRAKTRSEASGPRRSHYAIWPETTTCVATERAQVRDDRGGGVARDLNRQHRFEDRDHAFRESRPGSIAVTPTGRTQRYATSGQTNTGGD